MTDDVDIETRLMTIEDELAVLRREFENVREELRALASAVRDRTSDEADA